MTEFFCCDGLRKFLEREGFTLKEYMEIEEANFCHKCGNRLTYNA